MIEFTLPETTSFVMPNHAGRKVFFVCLDTGEEVEVRVVSHDLETGVVKFDADIEIPDRYMMGIIG